MKRGIYVTEWGNAAFVSGPDAIYAWDLDAGERIPIGCVTSTWIREATDADDTGVSTMDDDEGSDE